MRDVVGQRVRSALERPGMPPAGARVLVACSGGPDSTTLLDVLHGLDVYDLRVASVDHGLRPEARVEAEEAARFARSLGLEASVLPVTTRPTMAAARQARYQALRDEAARVGAQALAVGHTATDQAETLLDRLIRGAGTRGLSAMARVRRLAPGLVLMRPMLDVSAAEVEAYVAERGLVVARDPTNRNPAYRRSRVRADILPLLRRERADVDHALVALADRLRADADALDAEAARVLAVMRARRPTATDDDIDVRALMELPDAIAARVVAGAAGVALEAVHVEAVRRLCADAHGTRTLDLPGGVVAERRYDRLRFSHGRMIDPGDQEMVVTAPGRYTFLGMHVDIPGETVAAYGPGLVLRNFKPGDHLGSRKLKRIFIDRKVPRPERRWVPLLARGSEVVWIARVDSKKACAIMNAGEPSVDN